MLQLNQLSRIIARIGLDRLEWENADACQEVTEFITTLCGGPLPRDSVKAFDSFLWAIVNYGKFESDELGNNEERIDEALVDLRCALVEYLDRTRQKPCAGNGRACRKKGRKS